MTIRKGDDWGALHVPSNTARVRDDHSITALLDTGLLDNGRLDGGDVLVVGLLGGDLMRTLGGSGDASRLDGTAPIPHLPVDAVRVVADGQRTARFVAHLVARRSWWRGPITAVMNAQFIGDWDVAPRSHPNDGKVDIVTVSARMRVQQRWQAGRRVRLGMHVPHPHISITQRTSAEIDLEQPTPVWLDGVRWGTAQRLEITVEPDAFVACV